MAGKKALIVGIDDYPSSPLFGCVNDALGMVSALERNGSGSVNFGVKSLTSNNGPITIDALRQSLQQLFSGNSQASLFYFAGHGAVIGKRTYLCTQDGNQSTPGLDLSEVIDMANSAEREVHNRIILLDCCFSGGAGNLTSLNDQIAALGKGVTIMTACRENEPAQEMQGHGLFTYLMLDALNGGAADILGRITAASVYSHVDQSLGEWEQRPYYKSHVDSFLILREVSAKVSPDILRRLSQYFLDASDIYPLTPEHEHSDDAGNPRLDGDKQLQAEFKELQDCCAAGLVEPLDSEHMYWAAMNSTGCRLTALGVHFHRLAKNNRI